MATGRKLKIGVIGCGRVAQAHLAAIENLKEEVELIGVADSEEEKAEEAKERWGARYYSRQYEDILKDREIEAVVIALPNHLHHPLTLQAAESKKHILIEKPMALNMNQGREMVEVAKRNGVILMVGQSRRFSDAVFKLQKHLSEIGTLFRIQISFLVNFPAPPTNWWKRSEEAGGLVILLQGSHSIDSILTWMKKMPDQVFTFSSRRNTQWEGEDEADILLSFDQGALASAHLSLSTSPDIHEAILVGTKGVLRLTEYSTGKPFGFGYHLDLNGKRIYSGDQIPSNYTLQLKEFIEAFQKDRPPLASGEEVLNTMLVLDAARLSEKEGRIVKIKEGGILK
ncbi:MAG: Gfo/Idh/MocA family oxidoreductase [Deltaproteobacteria bacterium]|nr:Gfo/Idh/MocA family oxidoreductase [Deltaproteobacteria bacterium]MBM4323330.1 Gfo/Idh/MocA family oxidoreductase [Deltaproteobacteria bacterium]MBM4347175.1 Gfo/Idh/MocA family oxidoreductase [Deltaproteobacteria bacterium]